MDIKRYVRAAKGVTHLLFRETSFIKYAHTWIASFLPSHNAIADEVPSITLQAKAWLEAHLQPDMSVFEYGSGGSTLFFAKRVKKLVSVEHDKYWYEKVSKRLSGLKFLGCEYTLLLREPEKETSVKLSSDGLENYRSTVEEYESMSFEKYVRSIDEYPDGCFDLVFVDGRARPSCIARALNKIRSGAFLMLDNSERERYSNGVSLLANFQRKDFFGIGLYNARPWQTSIWMIDHKDNHHG